MDNGTFISQLKYALNLVKKFVLDSRKNVDTSMSTTLKLGKDEQGKPVDKSLYRNMIGSMFYLTASRPDICFSVSVCVSY